MSHDPTSVSALLTVFLLYFQNKLRIASDSNALWAHHASKSRSASRVDILVSRMTNHIIWRTRWPSTFATRWSNIIGCASFPSEHTATSSPDTWSLHIVALLSISLRCKLSVVDVRAQLLATVSLGHWATREYRLRKSKFSWWGFCFFPENVDYFDQGGTILGRWKSPITMLVILCDN